MVNQKFEGLNPKYKEGIEEHFSFPQPGVREIWIRTEANLISIDLETREIYMLTPTNAKSHIYETSEKQKPRDVIVIETT